LSNSIAAARVIKQDARSIDLKDESVDLIVTSPPYINVIDYTHANRLMYLWMGWDIPVERATEIGARYRRKRSSVEDEYVEDMRRARDEMWRVLRPNGRCAVVIGESKRFPGAAHRIVVEIAESMELIWGPRTRTPTRRRVSDRAALEPTEWISVFKKR
jgi:DNA modification methylase